MGRFWLVQLAYISIPWYSVSNEPRNLIHLWALVLHSKPRPGSLHTYETRLAKLLQELDLVGCDFQRSLLRPGTTPLPEYPWDWFAGIPGKTAALAYFAIKNDEYNDNDKAFENDTDTRAEELENYTRTV